MHAVHDDSCRRAAVISIPHRPQVWPSQLSCKQLSKPVATQGFHVVRAITTFNRDWTPGPA